MSCGSCYCMDRLIDVSTILTVLILVVLGQLSGQGHRVSFALSRLEKTIRFELLKCIVLRIATEVVWLECEINVLE